MATYRAGEKIDDPLVIGYEFVATLQVRTPLAVLKVHRAKVSKDADLTPPKELWHGIWLPIFAPLVPGMPSFEGSEMASEVGPIPVDGGDFLPFLIRVREIAEASEPADLRRARLLLLVRAPRWADYVDKLGGFEAITRKLGLTASK